MQVKAVSGKIVRKQPGRWPLITAIAFTALCALNVYRSIGATMDVFTQLAVLTGIVAAVAWAVYFRARVRGR